MKKFYLSLALSALIIAGCSDKPEEKKPEVIKETPQTQQSSAQSSKEEPAVEGVYGVSADTASLEQQTQPQQNNGTVKRGKVVETMDAGGYTYVKVEENGHQYWIAGPQTQVAVGEEISFVPQMWMDNFHSNTLNRDFEKLLFVAVIAPLKGSQTQNVSSDMAAGGCATCESCGDKNATEPKSVNIEKPADGYSIAEIFEKKSELKGQKIKFRGEVTKVSRGIMGKDWVHLSDDGKDDIVVTAPVADVEVGDVVTVIGVVNTDVDLGYGYFFPVIVEEATFEK